MGAGADWTQAEDKQVVALVCAHGKHWLAIKAVWRGKQRSAEALRLRHRTLQKEQEEQASEASGPGSSAASVCSHMGRTGTLHSQQSTAAEGPRGLGASSATIERATAATPGPTRIVRGEIQGIDLPKLQLQMETSSLRQDWVGRSWARAVQSILQREAATGTPTLDRELLPSHAWLVHALQLDTAAPPHGLIYCDLVRAKRRWALHLVRSHSAANAAEAEDLMRSTPIEVGVRDALGLVFYPDGRPNHPATPLPTLLASGHNRVVISGPEARGAFYVSATLAMRWMGLCQGEGRGQTIVAAATKKMKPHALTAAVGDSIPLTLAIAAVASAMREGGVAERGTVTYGALYAGAFDAFLSGLRWLQTTRWPRLRVVPRFAAERDQSRRRVLRTTESYGRIYRSARGAATKEPGRIDILTSTPECRRFSIGAMLSGMEAITRQLRAKNAMYRSTRNLVLAVRRLRPKVVIVEQVTGAVTHHRTLATQISMLRCACPKYVWSGTIVDASALRSPHRRRRLIVVGVVSQAAA